ncbi:chromosome segregation protein SMC [Candidatus Pacearchaeota archaeon]|nr:chromosome segregation protein SMC [Candidatus Pacearchaeota archaeon]
MVYLKKLVAQGFKSFGKKTEINFDKGINVIVGPNGAGKSNISDALCFALGRLSVKSMRAAKSHNLIFMGSKYVKPAGEASVEVVFDNTDRLFGIEKDEISLKRIIRRNGQGIYKINDETKTRTEIIEMLAQAGIDPYGFNIILQGQIQSIVRMHTEDRRKIIEEVAGISIYELRKEKSLKELEKTDEKLKEISAVLRERTAYLKNLERERTQAARFKELEENIRKVKASILSKRLEEKQREFNAMLKSVNEKNAQKEKLKEGSLKLQGEIDLLSNKIAQMNKKIREASGLEQETLRNDIANLRAELEVLKVRKENYENRKNETLRRINEIEKSIPDFEKEIGELKKKSPLMAEKAEELKKKKYELEQIGEERKKLLANKNELNSLREFVKDKEKQISRISGESESALKQLEESSQELAYKDEKECEKAIAYFRKIMESAKNETENIRSKELESEKLISVLWSEIERSEKIKKDVEEIDTCPLCQSKITESHKEHVQEEADSKITSSREKIDELSKELERFGREKAKLMQSIENSENESSNTRMELSKHRLINERKNQIRRIVEEERLLREELKSLEERKRNLEIKSDDLSNIEEKYESKIREIEEISSRREEDIDTTILFKSRGLEEMHGTIKILNRNINELDISINEISESQEKKTTSLERKEGQEDELNERFKKMFEEIDKMQKEVQEKNLSLSEVQSDIRQFEDQINYLRIGQARTDAEKETLHIDLGAYSGVEILKLSMNVLEERMAKTEQTLREIGSVNMRALEVYEDIKKEYDAVQEKSNLLMKEKEDITKIIEEIDRKKSRTFIRTFNAINELFTRNFSRLSAKGTANLEIENNEDIFQGGVDIAIKMAKGKYFDVTSLSGGEQTLVALSLLFAIQEHKPYHFYIFDEIDAALDKRNSERLAGLLNQYMKSGQYVVITHNDAIIMDSDVLYGVSMHDGITKILSIDLSKNANTQEAQAAAQAAAQVESALDAPQEVQVSPEQNPFRDAS